MINIINQYCNLLKYDKIIILKIRFKNSKKTFKIYYLRKKWWLISN
jgi:hypothetical protein